MYIRTQISVSFPTEIGKKIEQLVESGRFRSKNQLTIKAVEKFLKEEENQQLATPPVTAAPTGQRGIVAASPLTGAEIQAIPAASPIIPQETTLVT